MRQATLVDKLVDLLDNNPLPLPEIYGKIPEEKPSTIRGRLNENTRRCFKRIGRGIYLSENGDTKAHRKGDVVLDMFAGSLSVAKAGLNLLINTISIEIDKAMIQKAISMRHLQITEVKA
jgi:hypothetical protein